ncbi:MAG: hypothetical protein Ct9H90mP13_10730 [Pseudomonadota bacterium]|nr:MAG: hypothetical protein Ct9H90mP13_10730 [Pseudomonadota bacterium]
MLGGSGKALSSSDKAYAKIRSVVTYEGTETIHQLAVGDHSQARTPFKKLFLFSFKIYINHLIGNYGCIDFICIQKQLLRNQGLEI